jgi:hypothetical protein
MRLIQSAVADSVVAVEGPRHETGRWSYYCAYALVLVLPIQFC